MSNTNNELDQQLRQDGAKEVRTNGLSYFYADEVLIARGCNGVLCKGRTQLRSEFNRNKSGKGGIQNRCRKCHNESVYISRGKRKAAPYETIPKPKAVIDDVPRETIDDGEEMDRIFQQLHSMASEQNRQNASKLAEMQQQLDEANEQVAQMKLKADKYEAIKPIVEEFKQLVDNGHRFKASDVAPLVEFRSAQELNEYALANKLIVKVKNGSSFTYQQHPNHAGNSYVINGTTSEGHTTVHWTFAGVVKIRLLRKEAGHVFRN